MIKKLLFKPGFVLSLILLAFFLKGVFVATLHPLFDGQDEARHYNSVQYLNEPQEKNWETEKRPHIPKKEDISDYNFSEEMIRTGEAADFNKWRHSLYETVDFSNSYIGKNENIIENNDWEAVNYFSPPDVVAKSLYYDIVVNIEKTLKDESILTRFYAIRLFSVLLGMLAVLFAYLIAKNIGFSARHALLLTAIITFQPKFSDYMTNINYDVITIPMFFLFTLGGILSLKNGPDWKNLSIMIFSAYIAFSAKGTGIVLFGVFSFLLLYFLHEKIKTKSFYSRRNFAFILALAIAILFVFFEKYLPFQKGIWPAVISLFDYLNESLTIGRFALSSRTYWGSLSWVDSFTLSNFTNIAWFFQSFSLAGLLLYFAARKKPEFLPEKKYVVFLMGMIAALQLGIRAFDWNVFNSVGSLDLGTPGRYFLPNLASHIILVFVGIGMFLHAFNLGKHFKTILATGLILIFSLSMYLIWDVLLYRYYL